MVRNMDIIEFVVFSLFMPFCYSFVAIIAKYLGLAIDVDNFIIGALVFCCPHALLNTKKPLKALSAKTGTETGRVGAHKCLEFQPRTGFCGPPASANRYCPKAEYWV